MVKSDKYDFSGWATKNDLKCSDGRVIRKDAFKHNDGTRVPLVWMHHHDDPANVLGHADLENRKEGVYAYCTFNNTESGENAKMLVEHNDVQSLSICANQLKQDGENVIHGSIKEVSLVLAGANPGATIDSVIVHGEASYDEAVICVAEDIVINHADNSNDDEDNDYGEETIGDVLDTLTDEQLDVVEFLVGAAKSEAEGEVEHADDGDFTPEYVQEIIDSLDEKQERVVMSLIGSILKHSDFDEEDEDDEDEINGEEDEDNEDNDFEGGDEMKHNVFESDNKDTALMHDGLQKIMQDAKRCGTLKESFLEHADEYGIKNIDWLQPNDHDIYDVPQFINNQPSGWVAKVINGVHNTPFAKVRTMFADITEDEARAKGYIKGKLKKEEVFSLLKRSVSPTTVYKKQKFDRDDLIDADFDIVPWIRQEMELKLDEEKARAYIFGDGRSSVDEDKINESNIIPVIADSDLFTIKVDVTPKSDESLEHALIDACVLAQDDYQGSGNTTAFIEAKQVSKMLLMEDKFGHRLYKNMSELASAMGVGEVVKVPKGVCPANFYGVILDLKDYNVGMKNGGKKTLFDDFDIDYNQMKYLIETRQSGALIRPYSAILLRKPADLSQVG